MPFPGFRRHSFTQFSIRQNAPASPGVYGISNALEWIFVGSTDNLQSALMTALKGSGSTILSREPTGFMFDPCGAGECDTRRDKLIAELRPACNGLGSAVR